MLLCVFFRFDIAYICPCMHANAVGCFVHVCVCVSMPCCVLCACVCVYLCVCVCVESPVTPKNFNNTPLFPIRSS